MKRILATFLSLALVISSLMLPQAKVCAEETAQDNGIPIYRLYNSDNGEHLYTSDANEKKVLYGEHGWGYEGVAWYAPTNGTPVYRLYNSILCNHLYTTDLNEINTLTSIDSSWSVDNNGQPLFYSGGDTPIYRVYNRELNGMHHLTTDKNEYDTLPTYGWSQEGISLSAVSLGSPIITTYCEGTEYVWTEDMDKFMTTFMDTDLYHKMDAETYIMFLKYDDSRYGVGNPYNAYTDLKYTTFTLEDVEQYMKNDSIYWNQDEFYKNKEDKSADMLISWGGIYIVRTSDSDISQGGMWTHYEGDRENTIYSWSNLYHNPFKTGYESSDAIGLLIYKEK